MPDPLSSRWPWLPRGRALLRWAAVAVLLALAAGVLLAGGATPPNCTPTAAGPDTPGSTTPGSTTPGPGSATPPPGSAETAAVPSLGVPAGAVGVLVRLADPAAATVLRPGSRVDLLPGPVGGAMLRDILVLAVVAGGLFDEPGAAALLVAVPADHIPAGRVPAGPDATRVTYEVIVRTG